MSLFRAAARISTVATSRVALPSVLSRSYAWTVEKEPWHKIAPPHEIVDQALIHRLLASTKKAATDIYHVRQILKAAQERALLKTDVACQSEFVQGLTLEETATLLNVDSGNQEFMKELYDTAFAIKERIYGNRIVLFAPVYLSNYCTNKCTYCGFRAPNHIVERKKMTDEELISQVEILEKQGHRRLLLLTGEHPFYTFEDLLHAIDVVANVKTKPAGCVRRINVEIPQLSVSDFKRLKATGHIGTYTMFQETYHEPTFRRCHPTGVPKSDYVARLQTMDRAQIAHIDDVGLGALYGLYDYRFEVMGLLSHAQHLDKVFHAGPHTISIPRMRPAVGAADAMNPPSPVSDADFLKLTAIIRCAVPYTGMIMSTRESTVMRNKLLKLGISQMSAGSKTGIGTYGKEDKKLHTTHYTHKNRVIEHDGQFDINDLRTMDEVVHDLLISGYVPSWCTACYRLGRTGEKFMKIAKRGDIHNFCHTNALLTLNEFIHDYATEDTKKLARAVIDLEKQTITDPAKKRLLEKKMAKIDNGAHDEYV